MAKDPAVLFYVQDFLVGVSFLTPLQKGHYITLLCHQQQSESGSLSEDKVKQLMGKDFKKEWQVLKEKFNLDDNGFYNKRMRKEIERRKKFSESQRKKISGYWKNRGNTGESTPVDTGVDTTVIPIYGNTYIETEIETENRKGGMGENIDPKNWDGIKRSFLAADGWQYQFVTSKGISRDTLISLQKTFVNDLELSEKYKSLKEVKSHFTNWFNKLQREGKLPEYISKSNGLTAREIEEKENRKKLGID